MIEGNWFELTIVERCEQVSPTAWTLHIVRSAATTGRIFAATQSREGARASLSISSATHARGERMANFMPSSFQRRLLS